MIFILVTDAILLFSRLKGLSMCGRWKDGFIALRYLKPQLTCSVQGVYWGVSLHFFQSGSVVASQHGMPSISHFPRPNMRTLQHHMLMDASAHRRINTDSDEASWAKTMQNIVASKNRTSTVVATRQRRAKMFHFASQKNYELCLASMHQMGLHGYSSTLEWARPHTHDEKMFNFYFYRFVKMLLMHQVHRCDCHPFVCILRCVKWS